MKTVKYYEKEVMIQLRYCGGIITQAQAENKLRKIGATKKRINRLIKNDFKAYTEYQPLFNVATNYAIALMNLARNTDELAQVQVNILRGNTKKNTKLKWVVSDRILLLDCTKVIKLWKNSK